MTNFAKPLFATTAETLAAAQQRNLEVLVETSRVVAAGAQTIVARQLAVFQSAAQDGLAAFHATCGANDVAAGLKTQLEFVMGAHGKALALAAEIAEIAQTTGRETVELMRNRTAETTAEAVAVKKKVA